MRPAFAKKPGVTHTVRPLQDALDLVDRDAQVDGLRFAPNKAIGFCDALKL